MATIIVSPRYERQDPFEIQVERHVIRGAPVHFKPLIGQEFRHVLWPKGYSFEIKTKDGTIIDKMLEAIWAMLEIFEAIPQSATDYWTILADWVLGDAWENYVDTYMDLDETYLVQMYDRLSEYLEHSSLITSDYYTSIQIRHDERRIES